MALNYGYADESFFAITATLSDNLREAYGVPADTAYMVWGIARRSDGRREES